MAMENTADMAETTCEFPGFDLAGHDFSLTSIFKDYPKQCLPDKLNKPSGIKAKELQYEQINESMYDAEANMVAYRVTSTNIPFWIRSFAILYYEMYGKQSNYIINWYDEPLDWRSKKSGKKSICIDVSTTDLSLLYKLTFHINTGVVQVQGNHINQFIKKDFPQLIKLKQQILKANDIVTEETTIIKSTCDQETVTDLGNESDDEYFLSKTIIELKEETSPKVLIEYDHSDSNINSVEHKINLSDNSCQTDTTSLVPLADKGNSSIFAETLNRMESMFARALEKITDQQTTLLSDKMETMARICKDNNESHEKKYEALLDKLDNIIKKSSSVERENAELKGNLKDTNHSPMIEKIHNTITVQSENIVGLQKALKTHQSQENRTEHQYEALLDKLDTITKKSSNIERENADLRENIKSIDHTSILEKIHDTITDQAQKIVSLENALKTSNSQDNNTEFQEVRRRRSPHSMEAPHGAPPPIPQVTLIGTSHTKGINPEQLSSQFKTTKIVSYTINDTEKEVCNLQSIPDVLVFHSITNDLKHNTPSECVSKIEKLVNTTTELYPETKIIISLPTPRSDSTTINHNGQITSIMLKENYKDRPLVSLCDNSNLAHQGEPRAKYIDINDGYHLSRNGTSLLASNIRDAIDKALDLPKRVSRTYSNQPNNRGGFSNHRYNRDGYQPNRHYRGRGGYGRGGYN